jgi:hypothetical protein
MWLQAHMWLAGGLLAVLELKKETTGDHKTPCI